MKTAQFALYGNVVMARGECPRCERPALVIRGRFACCDLLAEGMPNGTERISHTYARRRAPSPKQRKAILKEQDHRCLYCLRSFGSYVQGKRGPVRKLRIEWDHMIPWSYSQNNRRRNFAAACQICNGMKGDRIFATLAEVRIYVSVRAEKKGLRDCSVSVLRRDVYEAQVVGKVLF